MVFVVIKRVHVVAVRDLNSVLKVQVWSEIRALANDLVLLKVDERGDSTKEPVEVCRVRMGSTLHFRATIRQTNRYFVMTVDYRVWFTINRIHNRFADVVLTASDIDVVCCHGIISSFCPVLKPFTVRTLYS